MCNNENSEKKHENKYKKNIKIYLFYDKNYIIFLEIISLYKCK